MKINKFCIFLITVSLFLLISIGSACAADVSEDAAVQLADGESDVVLADNDVDIGDDALQETADADTESAVESEDVCSLDETDTVQSTTNGKLIVVNSETEYKSGNFTFKLVDIDNNDAPIPNKKLNYTVFFGAIGTGGQITTNDDGIAILDNKNLDFLAFVDGSLIQTSLLVGNHPFRINSGTEDVICEEVTGNLTVKKAQIKIALNPYEEYYGSEIPVFINVTNARSGEPMNGITLHLYMENLTTKDYYPSTDKNGTARLKVTGLVGGTYSIVINNNDTVNMYSTTTEGSITILKIPVAISLSGASTTYYNRQTTKTITVTNKATGEAVVWAYVLVKFDGNSYLYQTNDEGKISILVAPSNVGKYSMAVITADNRYEGDQVTCAITVKKLNAKITASKLATVYKSGKKWTIKLKDTTNNKALANMKITLKVYTGKKYKTYTVKTNSKGVATFKASTLKKGTHKVVLSMSHKGYSCKSVTSSIKIKPKKLYIGGETNKLEDCGQLILGVADKKSKKLVSGIKMQVKIYTGKKYKTINVVTKKSKILGDVLVLIETNKFSAGKHKVTAKITSPNYYGSDKGYIVIPKSAKKFKPFTYVISNGKGKFI